MSSSLLLLPHSWDLSCSASVRMAYSISFWVWALSPGLSPQTAALVLVMLSLVPSASLMLLQSLPLGMPCLSLPGRSYFCLLLFTFFYLVQCTHSACGVKKPTPASPLPCSLPFLRDQVSLKCPFCGSPLCSSNSILVYGVCLGLGLDVISL